MSITIAIIICYMISIVSGHGYLKTPRSRNLVACKLFVIFSLNPFANCNTLLTHLLLKNTITLQIKIRIGNRTYHKPVDHPQIHIPKIVPTVSTVVVY